MIADTTPNARVEWSVTACPAPLRRCGDTVYAALSCCDSESFATRSEADTALGAAMLDAFRYTDLGTEAAYFQISEQLLMRDDDGEWYLEREVSSESWTYVGDALLDGDSWGARWFERAFDPETGGFLRRGVSLDGGDTFAPLAEVPDGLLDRAWETFGFSPAPLVAAIRAEGPATRRDFLSRYLSIRGGVVGRLPR